MGNYEYNLGNQLTYKDDDDEAAEVRRFAEETIMISY